MRKKLTYIVISVVICLLVGFLSGFATQTSVDSWYESLNKPFFNPPNWIFAPVWTTLYIMMGIAAGIVWSKGLHHIWVKTALYHFSFQLIFNAMWSVVFFGFNQPFWALLVILVLLALILLNMKSFRVASKTAAYLLVPYFIWVCFATLLNYKIWEMN